MKRVVITMGGTGGHVFPAVALAEELSQDRQIEILFVGGRLGSNQYFSNSPFPSEEVACSSSMRGFSKIGRGFLQSIKILRHFCPSVVVGFGSFYTVPTLLAARALRIPILLHEANAIPGRVNKFFAPMAATTALHFSATQAYFRGKKEVVGMPLRAGYHPNPSRKSEAYAYFGLDPQKKTVLVSGGSQGAEVISQAAVSAIEAPLQVVHLTGKVETPYGAIYEKKGVRCCVKAFEKRMELAWEVADFAVSRSGAGSLAEMRAFRVPCVLVPFAKAADNHQERNADFYVNSGCGVKVLEKELSPERLKGALKVLADWGEVPQGLPIELSLSDLVRRYL